VTRACRGMKRNTIRHEWLAELPRAVPPAARFNGTVRFSDENQPWSRVTMEGIPPDILVVTFRTWKAGLFHSPVQATTFSTISKYLETICPSPISTGGYVSEWDYTGFPFFIWAWDRQSNQIVIKSCRWVCGEKSFDRTQNFLMMENVWNSHIYYIWVMKQRIL
jgi:hypothetical protein